MAALARGLSKHIRRAMTGVGRTSLVSQIDSNRSIIVFATVFDKSLSLQDLTQRLNDKLLTFDRFKSKITRDMQYFEIINEFDCLQCIEELVISSETLEKYETLQEFIEETLSSFSNRPFVHEFDLPLWRLHVFQFQSLQQTVIIFRCHHCICDGITFGQIWFRLTDNSEIEESDNNSSGAEPHASISSLSTSTQSLLDANKCNSFWHKVLFSIMWLLAMIYVVFKLLLFSCTKEPDTIFKHKLSEQKYVSYIADGISVEKINKTRKSMKLGSKRRITFNDYMLTVIAESVSLYLQEKKEYIPEYVHLGIPVNIRDKSAKQLKDTMLGNKIGSYVINFPISSKMSFSQRLKRIKSKLDLAKRTPEAKMSYYAIMLLSLLPKWMADVIGPRTTNKLSLVASNVKGADTQMTICGVNVVDAIGIVPPPMGVGLGYVIFTYNGKVIVTVNVDKNIYDERTAKELMQCLKKVLQQQKCVDDC